MNNNIFQLGQYVGRGCFREVYASALWPSSRVVKVAYRDDNDFNRKEWAIWQLASNTARRFLAPCYAISDDGKYLLMRRTQPPTPKDVWYFRVPDALNEDLHRGNMGKLMGRLVIHDYGGRSNMNEAAIIKEILERIDAASPESYSRPQACRFTQEEIRQYGLA